MKLKKPKRKKISRRGCVCITCIYYILFSHLERDEVLAKHKFLKTKRQEK